MLWGKTSILLAMVALFVAGCEGTGNDGTTPGGGCALLAGSLVVTEVFQNPIGPDEGREWFEVYNPTDAPVALLGVTFRSGSGTTPKIHTVPAALDTLVPAHGYLSIGNGTLGSEDGIPGYSWPQLVLSNTSGLIVIQCGEVEVDRVAYGKDVDGAGAPLEGVSWQLASGLVVPGMGAQLNDVAGNWCESTQVEAFTTAEERGTPGAANGPCPIAGQCTSGQTSRAVVKPAAGQLVVTEVFANNEGADDKAKEWFEIHALAAFDLNGLVFEHSTTGVRTYEVVSEACLSVTAGDYVVVGGSVEPTENGGIADMAYAFGSGLTLYNDAAVMTVKDADGLVLHTASHPTSGSKGGVAVQLKPGMEADPTAAADVANWCNATTTGVFEGTGSPGAANGACEVVAED